MANCTVQSPPVFTTDIPKWDRNTYADGNAMGTDMEKLFNNTIYNKAKAEQALGKVRKNLNIPASGWQDLEYVIEDPAITERSTIYIGYAFDSVPVAQKAGIRGRAEAQKLVLVAKKAPSQNLVIDELRILNLEEE